MTIYKIIDNVTLTTGPLLLLLLFVVVLLPYDDVGDVLFVIKLPTYAPGIPDINTISNTTPISELDICKYSFTCFSYDGYNEGSDEGQKGERKRERERERRTNYMRRGNKTQQ